MKYLTTLLFVFISVPFRLGAQALDVNQTIYTTTNDLNSDGRSGQIFTATKTATLNGIRLFVEGKKWVGNYPYGSAFTVSLHRVIGGKIQDSVIASGSASKETIQLGIPVQLDVYFIQPYNQSPGDDFAFTILESSGGGSNGWNEYGMAVNNVYAQGTQFYSYSSDQVVPSGPNDFAFSTLITPIASFTNEKISIVKSSGSQYNVSLSSSVIGRTYVIQQSPDLLTWQDGSQKTGTGGSLSWVMNSTAPSVFYRIRIQ